MTNYMSYWQLFFLQCGLLLFVCVLLYLIITVFNFSLNPRVNLMAVIFMVGGLILLKGVIAKRVYKNWPLNWCHVGNYYLFQLGCFFSSHVVFGGNQVACSLHVCHDHFYPFIGGHCLSCLTLHQALKCSFVGKAFKWTSSKLLEKKQKEQPPNDTPEELDGYRLERSAAEDQELPTITHTSIEISQPAQNQDEKTYW